ncbi:MAG: RAMP superfamily CRISPR-associated protein, partial [Fimbriimonadales bacterium]
LRQRGVDERKASATELYLCSCYACKLFGNTGIASRIQVGDLYPYRRLEPLTETRYGVAIDRVTGAVAVGPFQMEVVTSAVFIGKLVVRNFTIGQLGLLAAVLLDIGDGLVALGHAKSRGLGRVLIRYDSMHLRFSKPLNGSLLGIGALADSEVVRDYQLPQNDRLELSNPLDVKRESIYHVLTSKDEQQIRTVLESAVTRWVQEVATDAR